jgi:class 3 adenylate cyclase/tetratricopeptide (TPR) repeat protein
MPVSGAQAPEERKVVTVLFADLADSTELATGLDPERFREVMAEFYRVASDEVTSLRGRTEKFVGDAVMAVFGLPLAHDDDALRAVRAGLSIRDRVARLGERLGLSDPLSVRVGVNTGPVAATTAPAGDFLVSGVTVNLAARLQQAAQPGEVLAGDMTWQLTRHAAEFGPSRAVPAKGFAGEISACPVTALSTRSSRRTIPLVGRRREVRLLRDTFERAREASRAHLVTVIGEAGVGKSRLVEELKSSLPEEAEVLIGRASEFGEDVAFAPLADMVRRRLHIEADTDPDGVEKMLRETAEGFGDPAEGQEVAARLGLLLGIGDEARRSGGGPYRTAEIRAGLSSYLGWLSRSGPVVMVLEDLHLARQALLELVTELIRQARRQPLLVVAVGREDLFKHHPDWGGGLGDTMVLRLEILSFDEARELASAAGEPLEEKTAVEVARHAGGNPFFIIETTGMLLHERGEEPHAPRVSDLLPPTVQAVVASRIDHLPDRARNVIRIASVFPGNAFQESKLALVTEADPDVLRTLEEEELIVRDEDRLGRWRFRHELLREIAYESVSKRERRRLHERIAEGLDGLEASEKHAGQVAYHLEEAARAAADVAPSDGEPARRAEEALRRAGDLARWRMESRAAVDLYERSLRMAGPEEGWAETEARILASVGESRYWLGEYERAEAVLRRALEVAPDDAWTRALAHRFVGDITLNIHGDPDEAERLFDGALAAARELDNPWALARTLLMAGWVPYWRGAFQAAEARFQEALEIARSNPDGDPWAEARALTSLASLGLSTDHDRSVELADRALALGREMGDPFTVATAQERRSGAFRRVWRLDDALGCSNEAVRIYRELGARWELASALGDRATIYRLAGRLEAAETDAREALSLCLELGDRVLVAWTTSELATVLVMRGEVEAARRVLDDSPMPASLDQPGDRTAILWARSLLALAEGNPEEARRLGAEILELDRARGRPDDLAITTWWLGRLFGPEAAGGVDAVEEARRFLEGAGWVRFLKEPDQVRSALALAR